MKTGILPYAATVLQTSYQVKELCVEYPINKKDTTILPPSNLASLSSRYGSLLIKRQMIGVTKQPDKLYGLYVTIALYSGFYGV